MAKPRTFLFDSSDFLTGTMAMSDAEVGQYIRLLCYQHQHGHFDEETMQRVCNGIAMAMPRSKFVLDNDGLFYNERLEKEVERTRNKSEKQRVNANMRWHSDGNAVAMPVRARGIIIKKNKEYIEEKKEKEKRTNVKSAKIEILDSLIPEGWPADAFKSVFMDFWEMRNLKRKPLTENAVKRRIKQLYDLSAGDYQIAVKIAQRSTDAAWDEFYPLQGTQNTKNGRELRRDQA